MTLGELYARLDSLMRDGASPDCPVIVEGHTDEDEFVQAGVDNVDVEDRCEGDDEPPGVYLDLCDLEIS